MALGWSWAMFHGPLAQPQQARSQAALPVPVASGGPDEHDTALPTPIPAATDPLLVIAGYNETSVVAAQQQSSALLEPFLVPDSPVAYETAAEFKRRAAIGEVHQPEFVQWRELDRHVGELTASITLLEVWNDRTLIRGQTVASARNVTHELIYELRRATSTDPWRIERIREPVPESYNHGSDVGKM